MEEDLLHLFQCDQAGTARRAAPSRLKEIMESLEDDTDHDFGFIAEAVAVAGYSVTHFRGVLDARLHNILAEIPSDSSISKTATTVLKALWTIVYQDFWKPRCEAVVEAEKALHISKDRKRGYSTRQAAPRTVSSALMEIQDAVVQHCQHGLQPA